MGNKKKSSAKNHNSAANGANQVNGGGSHKKPASNEPVKGKGGKGVPAGKQSPTRNAASSEFGTSRIPWRLLILLSFLVAGVAVICTNETARAAVGLSSFDDHTEVGKTPARDLDARAEDLSEDIEVDVPSPATEDASESPTEPVVQAIKVKTSQKSDPETPAPAEEAHKPTAVKTEEKPPPEKKSEEKAAPKKSEEKPVPQKKEEPKPEKKQEQPAPQRTEEKPPMAKKAEKPATPKPEEKAATPKPEEKAATPKKMSAQQKEREDYAKSALTNDADFKIRAKLDEADGLVDRNKLEDALRKFDNILRKHPGSPRAQLGRARVLDGLADQKHSNELLEQAINGYNSLVFKGVDVPAKLLKQAGLKLSGRQQFRGWGKESVRTLSFLAEKFPEDVEVLKELGVNHLMIANNKEAKIAFQKVLKTLPKDGFAKVHMGFILKYEVKLAEAVVFLQEGMETGEPGTQDGRFFFHLGDAYQRLGRLQEAKKVYQAGADKGLFLSADQRSLYNVDSLTARPWWTAEQTGYQKHLKLLADNWRTIRDEGLANLNSKTGNFQPEAENLREKGEWQQLTIFQQGRKNQKVCDKVPKTCALVEKIADAKGCRRGQVKFSVMHPGVHVWPHCGPTNCRIRAHLGLVVPEGLRIRVTNDTRTWEEGKFIIFDDSFEHEVWHDGDSLRMVLIVDFWHPEITEAQKRSLTPI